MPLCTPTIITRAELAEKSPTAFVDILVASSAPMSWTSLCITRRLPVNNFRRDAHALFNRQRLLSKGERLLDCRFCGLSRLKTT